MEKLSVEVYRAADGRDCTNNGVTSRNQRVYLYSGDRQECIADAKENGIDQSALYVNKRILWNEKHYFAEPLIKGKGVQMFGGNFVYTSDSRFSDMTEDDLHRPLPVHDRYETQEQYESLSK